MFTKITKYDGITGSPSSLLPDSNTTIETTYYKAGDTGYLSSKGNIIILSGQLKVDKQICTKNTVIPQDKQKYICLRDVIAVTVGIYAKSNYSTEGNKTKSTKIRKSSKGKGDINGKE